MKKTLRIPGIIRKVTIESIDKLPKHCEHAADTGYTRLFEVYFAMDADVPRKERRILFYMGRGYKDAPTRKAANEVVVWYPKTGSMWVSCEQTFEKALIGAMADAWGYA